MFKLPTHRASNELNSLSPSSWAWIFKLAKLKCSWRSSADPSSVPGCKHPSRWISISPVTVFPPGWYEERMRAPDSNMTNGCRLLCHNDGHYRESLTYLALPGFISWQVSLHSTLRQLIRRLNLRLPLYVRRKSSRHRPPWLMTPDGHYQDFTRV